MPKTKLPALISTFALCFIFWLLITWSLAPQELMAGALVSLAAAWFGGRFFVHDQPFFLCNPLRLVKLAFYCLVTFMWELWKANWDMAKRAFSRAPNINPGIVKVPVGLKSEYAQAMLANSITLTPGTITMDVTEEGGQIYYYIHWIDVAAADRDEAGEIIKGVLERRVGGIWNG